MARPKPPAAKKPAARLAHGPAQPEFARTLGESVGRTIRPVLPLVGICALYGALCLALWWPLRNDAQARLSKARLMQPLLEARDRPAWLPESELRRLAQAGLAAEGRSVFEPGLAAQLARAYEATPWIERVGAVRLRYPAELRIEAPILRVPVARVECEGGFLVLDRKGFALPISAGDRAMPRPAAGAAGSLFRLDLPTLAGVRCRRVSEGQSVTEPEALEGLEVLGAASDALRPNGSIQPVRVQRETAGTWKVLLSQGTAIHWGWANDDARPEGEPSFREKKDYLSRRVAEFWPLRLRYIKLDVPGAPVMPL